MLNANIRRRLTLIIALFSISLCAGGCVNGAAAPKSTVCVVVDWSTLTPGTVAAGDLVTGLASLFPEEEVATGTSSAANGVEHVIYVGTPKTLRGLAPVDRLQGPESYVVTTAQKDGKTVGVIAGGDQRGIMYGVHGLLRKLGYGYTLDGDLPPAPRKEPFTFDGWDLADRPLVPRRFVFNWHNFLSGCSSWNLEHWQRWTTQSQKMGYNGIMVHAYGNNPMTGFAFEGADKPVGYLSATNIGRDWATMHVNDVRRLIGGEAFDQPVLGSTAAIDGTDRQRTQAAQELMAEVFEHAERRGVDVILAVDMDTDTANPQKLITRLPESARYHNGRDYWLPRPDTPEGYAYYKSQLAHLLRVYPQLDTVVHWLRQGRTPITNLKIEHLPAEWQQEYNAIVETRPEATKYWHSVPIFVLGKIAAAHQKMLKELGRGDVTLGIGSWGFGLQNAADLFMPKGAGIYPLDFEVLWKESRLESPGGPEGIARAAAHRPVYPVHWANHDDKTYVGPPYPPFENFYNLLAESRCDDAGYGVLHWTTRPLDLFFLGLSDAVWASSKNQSIETTCNRMALEWVGEKNQAAFGNYLRLWLAGLPMIGRDTGDWFIDRILEGYDEAVKTHKQRMELLDTIDLNTVTPIQRKRVDYFRGLERFILGIYENEALYRKAQKLQKEGDIDGARKAIGATNVPQVIRNYTDISSFLGITRGEQGLVVSLNLRWLTHYIALKQQLGMEPIRINYAPTSHDMLAQNRGRWTYFIDSRKQMWDVRGTEETKAPAYGETAGGVTHRLPDTGRYSELQYSGLASTEPISLRVSPMMNRKTGPPPGRYKLTLIFGNCPEQTEPVREFDLELHVPGNKPKVEHISLNESKLVFPFINEMYKTFDVELPQPGLVQVILTPVKGKAQINGLILEPVQ